MKKIIISGMLLAMAVFALNGCSNKNDSGAGYKKMFDKIRDGEEKNIGEESGRIEDDGADDGAVDSGRTNDVSEDSSDTDSGRTDDVSEDSRDTDSGRTDDSSEADGTEPVRITEKTVPDLQSFSDNRLCAGDPEKEDGAFKILYSFDGNKKFISEYIELLESRYNFKLRSKERFKDETYYVFDYIGPEKVSSFYYDEVMPAEDVELAVTDRPLFTTYAIEIWYAGELDYIDTGDRTSQSLENHNQSETEDDEPYVPDYPSDSGRGGGTGINNPQNRADCGNCHGSGKVTCPSCSGSGDKIRIKSVPNYSGESGGSTHYEVKEMCGRCMGQGVVLCPSCSGLGHR